MIRYLDDLDSSEAPPAEVALSCEKSQLRCSNGLCVPLRWLCDGEDDCGDGSDERNCSSEMTTCDSGDFRCTDGICIPVVWQCDGEQDCTDGLDEWEQLCSEFTQLSYFHTFIDLTDEC